MKFSILKENLGKALTTVNRAIPVKPQLPILNNILLKTEKGQLRLIGTNLETGIAILVGAKIEADGEITVPGRLLTEFVSSLPAGRVDISLEGDILKVKTNKISASFNTSLAGEFPPFPPFPEKTDLVFEMKKISDDISKVAFAASIDEGRPVLTGIKMKIIGEKLSLYATDGYRLSIVEDKFEGKAEEKELILPARTLSEVVRIAAEEKTEDIKLFLINEKNQAIFSINKTQVVTRLIDGEFPNVEKIVPVSFKTKVIFEKETLLQSVKIASLFARGASNIVKLKIEKKGVTVSANAPQVGDNQDFLEAKVDGEEMEVAFNFRFLIDLLNNTSDKEIIFESSGSLNPGVFKPSASVPSFIHIIMPVRLQG